MPVVKQDAIGLYIESGGYVARPLEATDLKICDRVEATHFGGSTVHGVGKDPTLPRGHYRDYWLGCGMASEKDPAKRRQKYDWYKTHCSTEVLMRKRASTMLLQRAAAAGTAPAAPASAVREAPIPLKAISGSQFIAQVTGAAAAAAPAASSPSSRRRRVP